jgi:hypothetical protein
VHKGLAESASRASKSRSTAQCRSGIKGGVTKVEGVMLDLNASAMASLKGALTKIG